MKKTYQSPTTATVAPLTDELLSTVLYTSRYSDSSSGDGPPDKVKTDNGDGGEEEPEPLAKRHGWDLWEE